MAPAKTTTERPLRADAERNRQRILAAAGELFADRGTAVSLDDIAAHAGVGVGTVYRRFPDRDTLIDALLEASALEMLALVEEAAANPDPWEGLLYFIEVGAEFHGRNRALKELMFSGAGNREWVDRVRGKIRPRVEGMVAKAKEQGKLRDDIEVFDVAMLELILASGIEFIGPEEPDSWRRLLVIIKDGLRAQRRRPTPQTAPPLTNEGLDRAMKRSARRARG